MVARGRLFWARPRYPGHPPAGFGRELTDTFRVTTVMDVSADTAASVAGRVGARSTTSVDDMLSDPDVDVVAICSPHKFHAEQVIAACAPANGRCCAKSRSRCRAPRRKRSLPFQRRPVCRSWSGDARLRPRLAGYAGAVGRGVERVHTVRSSIVLPPNPRFEDFATEVIARPDAPTPDYDDRRSPLQGSTAESMGLAIHDLPLVRTFCLTVQILRSSSQNRCDPSGISSFFGAAT